MRYGDFKKLVAEVVIARLETLQKRYREVVAEPDHVDAVLERGREHVTPVAEETVRRVKQAMGVYSH